MTPDERATIRRICERAIRPNSLLSGYRFSATNVLAILDDLAAADAETARVRARLADLTEVFLLAVEYLPLKDRFEAHEHPGTITDFERIAAAAALARTEEQATPETACFCCQQGCQEGCSCYEHSPDKIKDDEYMAQLEVRMAAAGVPTGTLYAESNAYGLYSKATELWYPETDEQRQACLRDGRRVAP